MFPEMMNDEDFFKRAAAHGKEPPLTSQNEHQRSELHFIRRIRLSHTAGLVDMFLLIVSMLASHPSLGWWWLTLANWALVWSHLAWQIASRTINPFSREVYNLKTDVVLAGMWVGVMGVNVLPSTMALMIMCLNLVGADGLRLSAVGLVLMVAPCPVTLELTDIIVSFNSAPLEWWLSFPIIVIYPLLFGWVNYQATVELAEHKRRLQVMSTRGGTTDVHNRRYWETVLRNELDNRRWHNRDMALLIVDTDHFKGINNTWSHDVGDEAIVALTRQLQITLRDNSVIGRFGGDEFAVIMSGIPAESVITATLRVYEGLSTLRPPNISQVMLRINVGAASLNPQMSHYREQLKSADLTPYKAKKAGHNHTEVAI